MPGGERSENGDRGHNFTVSNAFLSRSSWPQGSFYLIPYDVSAAKADTLFDSVSAAIETWASQMNASDDSAAHNQQGTGISLLRRRLENNFPTGAWVNSTLGVNTVN